MIKRKSGAGKPGGRILVEPSLSGGRTDGLGRSARLESGEAVGDYLADMIVQLERLARATNKEMLAYLLSMASVQAAAPDARWERSNVLH